MKRNLKENVTQVKCKMQTSITLIKIIVRNVLLTFKTNLKELKNKIKCYSSRAILPVVLEGKTLSKNFA